MSEENGIEKERRFLLTKEDVKSLTAATAVLSTHTIEQVYISTEEPVIRVRRKTKDAISPVTRYTMTIKGAKIPDQPGACYEQNTDITEAFYNLVKQESHNVPIFKTRLDLKLNGFFCELDIFEIPVEDASRMGCYLAILEVEADNAEEFVPPEFLKGREITGNYSFSNAYISEMGYGHALDQAQLLIAAAAGLSREPFKFEVTGDMAATARHFQKTHRCPGGEKGRNFTFSFTPDGISDGASIRCAHCKRVVSLVDVEKM